VEQFEQIRRDRAQEGLSIRELARRHGVHRRAVRQALKSAVPPPKRKPVSRPAPKLGPFRPIVDEWLRKDQEAPRKQRHTARRVWQRLLEEHGADVSERQVCRYVAAKRREIGEVEACVPLVSDAGVEAEVSPWRCRARIHELLLIDQLTPPFRFARSGEPEGATYGLRRPKPQLAG
jgi:AcrR family transcriptional regulator